MGTINWECKKFTELSNIEIYQILQLRNEVFVVEQNCVYNDTDSKDLEAYHLFAHKNKKIIAYARLLKPGVSYKQASIGRVLTPFHLRKNGHGKLLIQNAIKYAFIIFNVKAITIGAQVYLFSFYENVGFKQNGDYYLEDGIEHVEMILQT